MWGRLNDVLPPVHQFAKQRLILRFAVGSQKERLSSCVASTVAMLVRTQGKLVWPLAALRGNSKLLASLGLSASISSWISTYSTMRLGVECSCSRKGSKPSKPLQLHLAPSA